jgi:hypothetical protein
MKKIVLLAFCVALSAMLFTGCVAVNIGSGWAGGGNSIMVSGAKETYTFSVGEITEIKASIFCNIEFYTAASDTVTLEIQPNAIEHITVEEKNGVLTVRSNRSINWSRDQDAPVLKVSSPALTAVTHSGAGRFTAHDTIVADSFRFTLSGAGAVKADLDVNDFSVVLSGAASYILSGSADKADMRMSGTGRIDALSLQTREANVNISGVGSISVHCTDNLTIKAGGMGSIEYKGSPSIDLSKGGMVSIKKVD